MCEMKAAFIVLLTDKSGEEPEKEIRHVQNKILSEMKYWRLEKFIILPRESTQKASIEPSYEPS